MAGRSSPRTRQTLIAAGLLLTALAAFLPTHWYDSIPRDPSLPLPFSGATLLRLTFLIEAAVVLWLGLRGRALTPGSSEKIPIVAPQREAVWDVGQSVAMVALAIITLLGLWLRLHRLDQDLWLDEISPIIDYTRLSAIQVIGSYLRSNNHLLNTILMKASVAAFGEHEWSVRLPAVLFGVATVPAIYWLARMAMSRAAGLGAALILAVSYHHVFFSQNARGYSAYLFFALLSTGFLIRALRDDRASSWAFYIGAAVLGSASLLITAFVLASHAIMCLAVGIRAHQAGANTRWFVNRVLVVFAITGFIAFQIYSAALPEAYVVLNSIYAQPSTGYAPFSPAFFTELMRGISAGFGNPIVAIVFLVTGAIGFAALWTLCWPLAASLALPAVLMGAILGAKGLTFSPRFFLLLLPLAILSAVAGVQMAVEAAVRAKVFSIRAAGMTLFAVTVTFAAAAGKSLPYYYRTPKQPYRAALSFAESRNPGGRIVVIYSAEIGFRYYQRRMPGIDTTRIVYTRDPAQFDSLTHLSGQPAPQTLTTFSRALGIEVPEIHARLTRQWKRDTTFAATIGDGEITVWSPREGMGGGTK
jgi:hypothetical protein